MDELYKQIEAEIEALIAQGKALVGDGLSWGDGWALVGQATRAVIKVAEAVDASGHDKKELALYCIDQFYEEVIVPIDIPYVPNWLENSVVDPAIGALVHELAERAIAQIIREWNTDGWPESVPLEKGN